jgi:threonine synthase
MSTDEPAIMIQKLVCTSCDRAFDLEQRYKCPACSGTLDAVYAAEPEDVRALMDLAARGPRTSMWCFAPLLPVRNGTVPVTIGEGWTPLVRAARATTWAGVADAHLKIEAANPTGSFKDRPISVALTKATELGVHAVVTASSGNAGAALAAYAARAGLPAVVLVPDGLPGTKLTPASLYGARIIAVEGHFSRAYELAAAWAEATGALNVTSTLLSAFTTEGNKTVAYELWLQLGRVPEWVLIPVSSGPLLVGIFKGFRELRDAGVTAAVPRMVAVQASGCAPITRAFDLGATEVEAWADPVTVASGIRDPLQGYAEDGTLTLRRVRESGGLAIAVDDADIMAAAQVMAREEGLAAEPTGAVAVAGLIAMARRGLIGADETVVCLVTGHVLKDPDAFVRQLRLPPPPVITPDLTALRVVLGQQRSDVG